MPDEDVPLAKLAYETERASFESQRDSLNQLRSRTGTLLAAGSITASFLGGQTLANDQGFGFFSSIALIAFVASIGPCIYILAPKRHISFALDGSRLHELFVRNEADEASAYLNAAAWLGDVWEGNQAQIERMDPWFTWASIALIVEVVCWAVALRGTL